MRRLASRRLVGFYNGWYWLTGEIGESKLLVENFRGENESGRIKQVWSKKDMGYAAPLEYVLTLAALRGIRRVVQVELDEILGNMKTLEKLGINLVKLYRDPSPPYNGKWKIELSLDHPPLNPDPSELDNWIQNFLEAKHTIRKTLH